jgi:hypothetical protein
MSQRVEVTEDQWVAGLREVDYVVLDLGTEQARPWLDDARENVELIGRCAGPADQSLLDRALELDVDFLALASVAADFDARRLPLRLIVEQQIAAVGDSPDLFGAAWARRISGWGPADRDTLASLARRERIFLAEVRSLPERAWLDVVAPFAVAAPVDCDPAEALRIRSL